MLVSLLLLSCRVQHVFPLSNSNIQSLVVDYQGLYYQGTAVPCCLNDGSCVSCQDGCLFWHGCNPSDNAAGCDCNMVSQLGRQNKFVNALIAGLISGRHNVNLTSEDKTLGTQISEIHSRKSNQNHEVFLDRQRLAAERHKLMLERNRLTIENASASALISDLETQLTDLHHKLKTQQRFIDENKTEIDKFLHDHQQLRAEKKAASIKISELEAQITIRDELFPMVLFATIVCSYAMITKLKTSQSASTLHEPLLRETIASKHREIEAAKEKIAQLENALRCAQQHNANTSSDVQADSGGLITLQCGRLGKLGCDFDFLIYDSSDQENTRTVKIQCPGVSHRAVNCEIIANGCIVTIQRQATDTITATTWSKKFQFNPSDGLFDFQQERMELAEGFLVIIFRKCALGTRLVRFPEHYSMAASDFEHCWTDVMRLNAHTLAECAAGVGDASDVSASTNLPHLPLSAVLDETAITPVKTMEIASYKEEIGSAHGSTEIMDCRSPVLTEQAPSEELESTVCQPPQSKESAVGPKGRSPETPRGTTLPFPFPFQNVGTPGVTPR